MKWRKGIVARAEADLFRIRNHRSRHFAFSYEDILLGQTHSLTHSLMYNDADKSTKMTEGESMRSLRLSPNLQSCACALIYDASSVPEDPPSAVYGDTGDVGCHIYAISFTRNISEKELVPAREAVLHKIQGHIGVRKVCVRGLLFSPA